MSDNDSEQTTDTAAVLFGIVIRLTFERDLARKERDEARGESARLLADWQRTPDVQAKLMLGCAAHTNPTTGAFIKGGTVESVRVTHPRNDATLTEVFFASGWRLLEHCVIYDS